MLAVQCVSDIAAHLIADQNWQPVTTNAEAFDRLSEHHVIPQDLTSALRKAVGFRNAVAHGYLRLRADLPHQAATDGLDEREPAASTSHIVETTRDAPFGAFGWPVLLLNPALRGQ